MLYYTKKKGLLEIGSLTLGSAGGRKKNNIQSDTVKWTFPIFQWKSIGKWFSIVDITCNLWNRRVLEAKFTFVLN